MSIFPNTVLAATSERWPGRVSSLTTREIKSDPRTAQPLHVGSRSLTGTGQGGYTLLGASAFPSSNATNATAVLAISTDSWGNLIIGGHYPGREFTVGSHTINNEDSSGSSYDGFAAKLTSLSTADWVLNIGSAIGDDVVSVVASDSDGYSYIGGMSSSTEHVNIGPETFVGLGKVDSFVVAVNLIGTVVWLHHIGGTGDDIVTDMVVSQGDRQQDIYISGWSNSPTMVFDSNQELKNWAYPYRTSFVIKLDAYTGLVSKDGTGANSRWHGLSLIFSLWQASWMKTPGSSMIQENGAYRVAIDSAGRVWLAGSVLGNQFTFNSTSTNTVTSAMDENIYLLSFSQEGDVSAALLFDGDGDDEVASLAVVGQDIFFAGKTASGELNLGNLTVVMDGAHVFMARLNASDLSPLWGKPLLGGEIPESLIMSLSDTGSVVLGFSSIQQSMVFPGGVTWSTPDRDTILGQKEALILEIDYNSGNVSWVSGFAADGEDLSLYDLTVEGISSKLYISGSKGLDGFVIGLTQVSN